MRILHSLTYYTPYVSGLTIYVKRLCWLLSRGEVNNTVICMRHDNTLAKEEETKTAKIIRADVWFKLHKGFLSWDWWGRVNYETKINDVVIINLPQLEGWIPALLAKIRKKPVYSIYHCEIKLPPGIINRVVEKVVQTSGWLSMYLSSKIITYTQDYAQHSESLRKFKAKVITIYPPIFKPGADPDLSKNLDEILPFKKKPLIGVAARLAAEKGIEYLLAAVNIIKIKYPNVLLIIAGPTDPVGENQYRKKIEKLLSNMKEQVIFLGNLPDSNMGSFYKLLDVLALPSVNSTESFGMVQVEAMMWGVPVVASNLPGVREAVKVSGMGLLAQPGNSRDLANKIIEVLNNKRIYLKPKSRIAELFNAETTQRFYNNLLGILGK